LSKNPLIKLNDIILSLNPFELTTLAFIIGIILADGLDYNKQQSLGNFYEQIGQTMLTIGAQGQNLDQSAEINEANLNYAVNLLKNKIGNIESIIADLKNL